jgi:hypothetical protein
MQNQRESSPTDAYQVLGFQKFVGEEGQQVDAARWRAMQSSDLLEDVRNRILIRRDKAGAPLVDQEFVVGWIPPLNIGNEEVEKLLCTLTLAMSRGCTTVAEWQQKRSKI